jgi:3-deoxy-7-phosphoheptulonate synthase
MIVAMQEHATEEQIDAIIERMVEAGVNVHRTTGATQTILAGVGPTLSVDIEEYKLLPGVLSVHRISSPYKLAGRAFRPEGTIVSSSTASASAGTRFLSWLAPVRLKAANRFS